jgi:hypothetical protein
MKFTQRSGPFKTKTNFYRLVFSQDCAFDILFSFATKIIFRFVSVKGQEHARAKFSLLAKYSNDSYFLGEKHKYDNKKI